MFIILSKYVSFSAILDVTKLRLKETITIYILTNSKCKCPFAFPLILKLYSFYSCNVIDKTIHLRLVFCIRGPVSVLVPLPLFSFLLMHLEVEQVSQVLGSLAPMWETRRSSWLLATAWPNSNICGHLGSKMTDRRSFSLPLPLKSIISFRFL